jgi:pantoate--beta-alanine ligase
MRRARAECSFVVVSLFVNPTQFGTGEDLERYPRDLEGDTAAASAEGVDVLFVPAVDTMVPQPALTTVHVGGLSDHLCGASRPGHFDGVATIVTKLFSIVGPCRAYFGRKDAQQLAIVRRLVSDLALPVTVVGAPLVREPDGLAMSSRNVNLSDDDRRAATVLSRALHAATDLVVAGLRDGAVLRTRVREAIMVEPRVDLDYVEVVDAATLEPVTVLTGSVLVAVAAFFGATRLIDNVTLTITNAGVAPDDGIVATFSTATTANPSAVPSATRGF